MSGHYVLNVPPYVPGFPKFYGSPGVNGEVLTDERVQAFALISAFGRQGQHQQQYVNFFFNGGHGTPGQAHYAQLGDIGSYLPLDTSQGEAINKGTSVTRPEFLVGATAPGLNAGGTPVSGVAAYQATTVGVGKVGSEYAKICADFQHNLNVGADGQGAAG